MEQHPYDKSIDVALGQTVREMRNIKGWNQKEMGRRLGVTDKQIAKYEGGFNKLSARKIYELAKMFKVPVEDMFVRLKPTGNQIMVSQNRHSLVLAGKIDRIKDKPQLEAVVRLVRSLALHDE